MTLQIMNQLELVKKLREIALANGCHLTLRAAIAIVHWLKQQ